MKSVSKFFVFAFGAALLSGCLQIKSKGELQLLVDEIELERVDGKLQRIDSNEDIEVLAKYDRQSNKGKLWLSTNLSSYEFPFSVSDDQTFSTTHIDLYVPAADSGQQYDLEFVYKVEVIERITDTEARTCTYLCLPGQGGGFPGGLCHGIQTYIVEKTTYQESGSGTLYSDEGERAVASLAIDGGTSVETQIIQLNDCR